MLSALNTCLAQRRSPSPPKGLVTIKLLPKSVPESGLRGLDRRWAYDLHQCPFFLFLLCLSTCVRVPMCIFMQGLSVTGFLVLLTQVNISPKHGTAHVILSQTGSAMVSSVMIVDQQLRGRAVNFTWEQSHQIRPWPPPQGPAARQEMKGSFSLWQMSRRGKGGNGTERTILTLLRGTKQALFKCAVAEVSVCTCV